MASMKTFRVRLDGRVEKWEDGKLWEDGNMGRWKIFSFPFIYMGTALHLYGFC